MFRATFSTDYPTTTSHFYRLSGYDRASTVELLGIYQTRSEGRQCLW